MKFALENSEALDKQFDWARFGKSATQKKIFGRLRRLKIRMHL